MARLIQLLAQAVLFVIVIFGGGMLVQSCTEAGPGVFGTFEPELGG